MSHPCITVQVVYDDSDPMTDYYAPDRPLYKWRVLELGERPRITEPLLRRALALLPAWLRAKEWTYRKGEKYSMSNHPYGQLRGETLEGLEWPYGYGGRDYATKGLGLLMDVDWLNEDEYREPVPADFEAMRVFVAGLGEKRRAEEAEAEARRNSPEGIRRRFETEINQWRSLTAVFDEKGFRTITPEERTAKIAALEAELERRLGLSGSDKYPQGETGKGASTNREGSPAATSPPSEAELYARLLGVDV